MRLWQARKGMVALEEVSMSLCACVLQNGRQQWKNVSVCKCTNGGTGKGCRGGAQGTSNQRS